VNGALVARRLNEKKTPEQIIEELYIRCFSRKPTSEEMQKLVGMVSANPNKQQALEDIFWALVNAREFMFNH